MQLIFGEDNMEQKEDYVFGIHPVMEALNAGKTIEKVLIQKGLRGDGAWQLQQLLRQAAIPWQVVPVEKLNRITRANHQGVIALVTAVEFTTVEAVLPGVFERGETPFIILLDRITDVRNFGAIARTAECAGVHAVVIPEKNAARIGSDAVKTSAGALLRIPVCRASDLNETIRYLKNSGLHITACTEKTTSLLGTTPMNIPLAIVMGAEDTGIGHDIIRLCDSSVRIPMTGEIQSLNVSVAAGIVTWEVLRQRNQWK